MLDSADLLRSARLVTAHAGQRGIVLDQALFDAINAADQAQRAKTYGVAEEQRLQQALAKATAQIRPASIESLKKQEERESGHWLWTLYHWVIHGLVLTAFGFLLLLIIPLTVFYNHVSDILGDIKVFEDAHYFTQLHEARSLFDEFTGQGDATKGDQTKVDANRTDAKKLDAAKNDETHKKFLETVALLNDEDTKIFFGQKELSRYIDLSTQRVAWWLAVWTYLPLGDTQPILQCPPTIKPGAASGKTADAPPPGVASVTLPIPGALVVSPSRDTPSTVENDSGIDDSLFAAKLGLGMRKPSDAGTAFVNKRTASTAALLLGASILPLLYGFLGATVFLMRSFSAMTPWEPASARPLAATILRFGLGGIAGLAIGWFTGPDVSKVAPAAPQLTTTPFALAFLAGFAIEVLFSLLDRFIAAFAAPAPAHPPN